MSDQIKPVAWIKFLNGAEAKSSGACFDLVFCELEGYSPLYSAEQMQHLQAQNARLLDSLRTKLELAYEYTAADSCAEGLIGEALDIIAEAGKVG